MCEAIVYLVNQGEEKEVMQDVQFLEVQGEQLLLSSLFGDEVKLRARVKNINFMRHKVTVEEIH
jgi:predicted RNA-binding protein